MDKVVQEVIKNLDNRVVAVAKRTNIDVFETCVADHNKAPIKDALRNTLNGILKFVMEDASKIGESFVNAVVRVALAPKLRTTSVAAIVKNVVVIRSIAKFAVENVKKAIDV